jgi:tetratricopeptide (TPR) repeat protein
MRILSFLFIFIFLQACAGSQKTMESSLLFPFERNAAKETEQYPHELEISENGTQTFVYLGLYEAIKRDDYDKIKCYAEMLAKNKPEPLYLAEAVTWFYNKGYIREAKELLEQSLKQLPDELSFILMYAEVLQNQQDGNSDLNAVEDLLKQYIKKHPEDYNASIELGVLYYKRFQYESAYKTLLQIPEKARVSSVYLYLGICLEKMNRYTEAEKYFKRILREFPEEKTALHHLGTIAEAKGQYALARKYYAQVFELDNTNYDYLLKQLSLAFKEGNHQKAFEIAKEHFNFDFIVSASSMLIQEGRVDLAEELLNNLGTMENAPRELIYLHGALIYEAGQDKNRALSYLTQLNENDEHYKNALEIITYIYLEQNDFDNALQNIKKLQNLAPDTKNYRVLEYQTYLFQEKYEQAYEVLYAYLKDYPQDIHAKYRFAYTCFHLDEKEKAMQIMLEVLEADPEHYDALNFIGYSLVEQNKDLDKAEEYLLKADTLNPKHGYINDSLAWLYYTKKDYDKAFAYIEKAVAYSESAVNEDATMWEHYGDIAAKLGKLDIARTAYEKSLSIKHNDEIEQKLKGLFK